MIVCLITQVRYLKIIEKSGYQALPWVRYITQNGGMMLINFNPLKQRHYYRLHLFVQIINFVQHKHQLGFVLLIIVLLFCIIIPVILSYLVIAVKL